MPLDFISIVIRIPTNSRLTRRAIPGWSCPTMPMQDSATVFTALDFFAGSGLVRLALEPEFKTLWANDNCPKKRAVYIANHPADEFHLGFIEEVRGSSLPSADLAWASFPC